MRLLESKATTPFSYMYIARSFFKNAKNLVIIISPIFWQFILVKCEPPQAIPCGYLHLNIFIGVWILKVMCLCFKFPTWL